MYYHIKINYFDSRLKVNQTRFAYDISNMDDVRKIAKLYDNNSDFMFEGVKLKAKDIQSMDIYESDTDINTCVEMGDKELNNPLFLYSKTSIFEREDLLRNVTRTIFEDIANQAMNDSSIDENAISSHPNQSKKVFIVHGHDTHLRTEVEMLITQLEYEPTVLFKEADQGLTIIEKLEAKISDVAFSIVLYTGCDKGCAKEQTDLKPRARQNVVFEHGMMCAKLGRDRVVAILEDGVEMPGDLSGIIYKKVDPYGRWKYDVANEMKAAGLNVDLNKIR